MPFTLFHSLRRRLPTMAVTISLVLSFVAAIAVVGFNEVGYRRSAEAVGLVALHERVRLSMHVLMQSLLEAESSERGYLLTRDARFLESHQQATQHIGTELDEARQLFELAPAPGMAFDQLAELTRAKLGEMDQMMQLQASAGEPVWKSTFSADVDNELMSRVHTRIDELVVHNAVEIEARRGDIMRSLRTARIGIALTSMIALIAFYQTLRQARALAAGNQQRKEELERERDLLDRLVKKRTARLAELATHLQNVREDERAHLARELHDELGSLLTAAKLDVARLKSKLPAESPDLKKRLQHLTETLNSGIALKRRIIETLRPSSLSNLGLSASLGILTREFSEQSELPVQCDIEEVVLDEAAQLTVYRLIQESLTNIGKYAEASQVTVQVGECRHGVEVVVQDDGEGFNPEHTRSGAHGLEGMRHRVEAAGGELMVASKLGEGTRVQAWLPTRASPG